MRPPPYSLLLAAGSNTETEKGQALVLRNGLVMESRQAGTELFLQTKRLLCVWAILPHCMGVSNELDSC